MSTYVKYRTQEQPPKVSKTYRAALYIRLSKEDGDKDESDSVANQKKILMYFVDRNDDIEFADFYIDDGYTGANFDRPDFIRMIADINNGNINCIIVKDSSRFARNISESSYYTDVVFPKLQVRYISVNDAIDSARSQGLAIDFLNNSMRAMINEYFLASNSTSIRSTLDAERERGEFIGSFAKYGYKKDPSDRHKLLIDEEAADTVRLIYRLYLGGTGIRGIVRYLNDHGIPNPSTYKEQKGLNFRARTVGCSSLWSDKTVRRTLRDEMYIGNMVQHKFCKVTYKDKSIRACDEREWIRVEGTHEAIISPEDYENVQMMLDRGSKASKVTGEIDLFAGLLRCADCGHALIKKINNNPDKTYIYYRCSSHCRCGTACSAHTLRFEKLYKAVLECIRHMVDLATNADEVIKGMRKDCYVSAKEAVRSQLHAKEQELRKTISLLSGLYPDYKDGILSKEQYMIQKQNCEQKQEELRKSIERLNAAIDTTDSPQMSENEFITHFKQHGNIDRLTRPLLTELIDHITVSEDGSLDIAFNFTDAFLDAQVLTENKRSA